MRRPNEKKDGMNGEHALQAARLYQFVLFPLAATNSSRYLHGEFGCYLRQVVVDCPKTCHGATRSL